LPIPPTTSSFSLLSAAAPTVSTISIPLGYGAKGVLLGTIAATGVFVAGAAFSLREGIAELIHPSVTSSFAVAYVVLA